MNENNTKAKKIDIEEITMVNFQGHGISLLEDYTVGFEVFEDISNNTMSGRLYISDGNGLIERFPIIGDERVRIKFRTPLKDDYFEQHFIVSGVANRVKNSETVETYSLELVSYEFVRSQILTADKAYTGFYISDIFQSTFDIISDPDTNIRKKLVTEQTIGKHQFIAPENAPLEFIQLLASEARSKAYPNNSLYLFYEDRDQFNFRTVASLINQEPKFKYYYALANIEPSKGGDPINTSSFESTKIFPENTIEDFQFTKSLDVIDQIDRGMFDNYVTVIDPIFKQKKDFDFIYDRDFNKLQTLTGNKVISNRSYRTGLNGASHSRLFVGNYAQDNQNYYQESYLNNRCTPVEPLAYFPSSRYRFLAPKISIEASMNNLALEFTVSGNSELKCGDIVNIYVPKMGDEEGYENEFSYFLGTDDENSKFLVVRVNHSYDKGTDEYKCHVKVIKDSYANVPVSEVDKVSGLDYT